MTESRTGAANDDLANDPMPLRDFAEKEAALTRDAERRRTATMADADLVSAPGAETARELPAGTWLTVLGAAEGGMVPVIGGDGESWRGYIPESAVAQEADDLERPRGRGQQGRGRGGDRGDDRGKGRGKGGDKGGDGRGGGSGRGSGRGSQSGGAAATGTRATGSRGAGDGGGRSGGGQEPDDRRGAGGSGQSGGGGGGGDAGQRIATEAQRYVGRPYVWATHGPDTFDCSGLVHWVVLQATDQNISPDSHAQFNLGTPVEQSQLQPGDLLFYNTMGNVEREGNKASHVGIFVRAGSMINAFNEGRGVIDSDPFDAYFQPIYLGARRLTR